MIVSIAFHAGLVVLAMTGLPYIIKTPPILPAPISVDLVEIDKERQTNKPPLEVKKSKPDDLLEKIAKAPILKKTPPKQEKKPSPPKVDAKTPPKAVEPKPPEPIEENIAKPAPKIPPPPEKKLVKPKPPPPVKEAPKEEDKPAPPQEDEFESLLKNLQDSEEPKEEAPEAEEGKKPEPSPLAKFSQRMTMSESDALRRQLSQCWSIQAGARYAEDLVVEIRLSVARDRRVIEASVMDQWRYGQDPHFRAAADSALRAVYSPMCTPLDLPPEKYDLWKDIVVSFDPREML